MQLLSAPPRDDLTDEQVTALLQCDALETAAGCEVLNADLTVREDISDDLLEAGSRTEHHLANTIHGTCALRLTRALVWGVDLVRPYMVLTDPVGGTTGRVNLGVYQLVTPERPVGEDPTTYSTSGFDRLYLLARQVGRDYAAMAGTTYRQALLDAFTAAGVTGVLIEGTAADDVLPVDRLWPLIGRSTDPDQTTSPVTWLRVVNDLLRAINFRAVWCDEDGRFRCQAYIEPAERPGEFLFTADDPRVTIIGEERTVVEDVFKTPNVWVFRQTNRPDSAPAAVEGDGIYTVRNDLDGPTSVAARGLEWPSVIDYEAATQDKLVELGNRRVANDRRLTTTFEVATGPFPVAGHADVFTYADSDAAGTVKVQALSRTLPLDGSDMRWVWEAVR